MIRLRKLLIGLVAICGLLLVPATGAAADTALDTDTLYPGQQMTAGQFIRSTDNRFNLVMQGDGNLVQYDKTTNRAVWSTATAGTGADRAAMQSDGNLVVYRGYTAVWASGTSAFDGARLVVQTDGNVVVYRNSTPVWSKDGYLGNLVLTDQQIGANEIRRSPNGRFTLVMQGDGNLVQYDRQTNAAVWATDTVGTGANRAVMQGDGNFVIYRDNIAVWNTSTQSGGVRLAVQDDGNVVLYRGGTAIWQKSNGGIAVGATAPSSSITGKTDAFVSRYNGKSVDVDGAYGAQCTDLFNAFHRDVMGGSYVRMGGNGGAANLWNTTNQQMLNWYTKVAANQPARKGDIAVWSTSKPGSSGYGHVSIVLADKGSSLSTFTQNPGAAGVRDDSKAYLLGYFRPKG